MPSGCLISTLGQKKKLVIERDLYTKSQSSNQVISQLVFAFWMSNLFLFLHFSANLCELKIENTMPSILLFYVCLCYFLNLTVVLIISIHDLVSNLINPHQIHHDHQRGTLFNFIDILLIVMLFLNLYTLKGHMCDIVCHN